MKQCGWKRQTGWRRVGWFCIALVTTLLVACSAADGTNDRDPADVEATHDSVFDATDLQNGFDRVDGYVVSGRIEVDEGATRGAFLIDLWENVTDTTLELEVRGFDVDDNPTSWRLAEVTWADAPFVVARADLGATVTGTQIRIPQGNAAKIAHMVYGAVTPETEADDAPDTSGVGGVQSTQQALDLAALGVVTRGQWGARGTRCKGSNTNKYRMAIHHTFTPPASSGSYLKRVKSVQAYHMDGRGWCDVGYHFLITQDGKVYEGRPIKFRGAHVANQNTGNVGISYVGCFQPGECSSVGGTQTPTEAMIQSGGNLVGAISKRYGISVNHSRVRGHREHSGASTTCPGNHLVNRFDDIFAIAKGSTPAPPPADPGAGGGNPGPNPPPPPTATTGRILGSVFDASATSGPADFGNVRLPGATLLAEGAASTTSRLGDAFWSFELPVGTYTVTTQLAGYQSVSQTLVVNAGHDTWASVGLQPDATTSQLTVSAGSVTDAIVSIPGIGVRRADFGGNVALALEPGSYDVSVYSDGYEADTQTVTLGAGESLTHAVTLVPFVKPSVSGRMQGVVWDAASASSPSSSSAKRVDQAIVLCSCGQAKKVRAGDAFWKFDAEPGTYTFTVVATGYQDDRGATLDRSRWRRLGLARRRATVADVQSAALASCIGTTITGTTDRLTISWATLPTSRRFRPWRP